MRELIRRGSIQRSHSITGFALVVLLTFLEFPTVSFASATIGSPESVAVVRRLVALLSSYSGGSEKDSTLKSIESLIDYPGIAATSLGTKRWSELDKSTKDEFLQALSNLIETRYYPRWKKVLESGDLKYESFQGTSNTYIVKTTLSVGKSRQLSRWTLRRTNGKYKVINLAVGKKDLLATLSCRVERTLKKQSIKDLIASMKSATKKSS